MKNCTSIFLVLFTIVSCKNNENVKIIENNKNSSEIKPNFLYDFQGDWVLMEYVNSIEKTLSPIKSAFKLVGVVAISVPEINNNNTIEIGASWNNHEGYSFRVFLQEGQEINNLKTDLNDFENESYYYDIGTETINNKTYLILYHYNSSNKLLEKIKFVKVKVNKKDEDFSDAFQQIVNEKIFTGKYLLFDSTNTPLKVTFKSNGIISGHPEFKNYYVFTDFLGGPEPKVDEICFNFETNKKINFVFRAKKDTIFLFNEVGDGLPGGIPLDFGELKYKLVKIN